MQISSQSIKTGSLIKIINPKNKKKHSFEKHKTYKIS